MYTPEHWDEAVHSAIMSTSATSEQKYFLQAFCEKLLSQIQLCAAENFYLLRYGCTTPEEIAYP